MIAVDTSALVAILQKEDEARRFAEIIEGDDMPLISAGSLIEFYLVMKYKKIAAVRNIVEEQIRDSNLTVVPVCERQALLAVDAGYQFSVLNYGDTFSYALAKDKGLPLLFKGDDFGRTDVVSVL